MSRIKSFYGLVHSLILLLIVSFPCSVFAEVNPREVYNHIIQGTNYSENGQFDAAIEEFNKAIELRGYDNAAASNPNYAIAYCNRGVAYHKKGLNDMAISDYSMAIELEPQDASAYNNRGNIYCAVGQYDAAIADYNVATKLKPQNANAYNNRGNAYCAIGRYDAGIADYDMAIILNPQDATIQKNRNIAYIKLQRGIARAANNENIIPEKPTNTPRIKQVEKKIQNLSWNGRWKTSMGEMRTKQTGDKVECIINDRKLVGSVIDNKIVGKWAGIKFFSSTEKEGEFQFIMSADGTFLKIKWKDKFIDWATDSTANRLL